MAEACPAYPWQEEGAQRGHKVFMLGNCTTCHQAMFREPADVAARGDVLGAHAAEIVVVMAEEVRPAAAAAGAPRAAAYKPDLATLAAKIQAGPLHNNVYFIGGAIGAAMPAMFADGVVLAFQELKKKIALQFAQPYTGNFIAA